jgi:hypothetical protein
VDELDVEEVDESDELLAGVVLLPPESFDPPPLSLEVPEPDPPVESLVAPALPEAPPRLSVR